jgi:hypothetical protein
VLRIRRPWKADIGSSRIAQFAAFARFAGMMKSGWTMPKAFLTNKPDCLNNRLYLPPAKKARIVKVPPSLALFASHNEISRTAEILSAEGRDIHDSNRFRRIETNG